MRARSGWTLAALAALAAASMMALPAGAEAQNMRSVTMSRQLEGDDEVRVSLAYGAGRFTVRSMDEGLLYRMNLRYDEDLFEPVAEYRPGRLEVGVETVGRRFGFGRREAGELSLELARGVPMDLELDFGAVQADIDLGGLALTGLELSTGASDSRIDVSEPNTARMGVARFEVGAADFTALGLGNLNADRIEFDAGVGRVALALDGEWQRDGHVSIEMGLGALELLLPEGVGVRLRKDSFLTSLDAQGLVRRGDTYESVDWDDAERRITIDLDAAFGSVDVDWIR